MTFIDIQYMPNYQNSIIYKLCHQDDLENISVTEFQELFTVDANNF